MISSINRKVVWDFGGGEPTCISKALLFYTFLPAEVFSIALLNLELTLHFTFFKKKKSTKDLWLFIDLSLYLI